MKSTIPPRSTPAQQPSLLEMNAVSHSFGTLNVLQQVSLSIRPGEIVAILGPNGAGKTTLINLLLGVHQLQSGALSVFDSSPGSMAVRQRTGVMLQEAELAETLTVEELIRQFSVYYRHPLAVDVLLKMSGLSTKSDRRYSKLSGGEKRRCQFAIALAGEPDLLFLDEPTTGLDVQARRTLWQSVREYAKRGAGVVLTTHYLDEADSLADRIIVLNNGRIVASGTPSEIKQSVSLKQLTCVTSLDTGELKVHTLVRDIQEIRRYENNTALINITTTAVENLLRELLEQDANLSELQVNGADLEQAFISLTQDSEE